MRIILKALKRDNNMIQFVKDRPGHDLRYSLDSWRIYKQINWRPRLKFKEGIRLTVDWYLKNNSWLFSKYTSLKRFF